MLYLLDKPSVPRVPPLLVVQAHQRFPCKISKYSHWQTLPKLVVQNLRPLPVGSDYETHLFSFHSMRSSSSTVTRATLRLKHENDFWSSKHGVWILVQVLTKLRCSDAWRKKWKILKTLDDLHRFLHWLVVNHQGIQKWETRSITTGKEEKTRMEALKKAAVGLKTLMLALLESETAQWMYQIIANSVSFVITGGPSSPGEPESPSSPCWFKIQY